MALASAVLPPALRASGLALVVTATSLARLVASIAFGVLWTAFGLETAVVAFAVGLVVALPSPDSRSGAAGTSPLWRKADPLSSGSSGGRYLAPP